MDRIITAVPMPDKALIEGYGGHSSATVHEAAGQIGAMKPEIKPVTKGMRICGAALTVKCHTGDNLMIARAIKMAREGQVLVADMGGASNAGGFGELLATECKVKKLGGFITSCAVRDSREIIAMGFPVFSAALGITGTAKATLGTINHPISCGGVIVKPGDIVIGDDDGVVVIPLEIAEHVLTMADERVKKENAVIERIKAGESLYDIFNYEEKFRALGYFEKQYSNERR